MWGLTLAVIQHRSSIEAFPPQYSSSLSLCLLRPEHRDATPYRCRFPEKVETLTLD